MSTAATTSQSSAQAAISGTKANMAEDSAPTKNPKAVTKTNNKEDEICDDWEQLDPIVKQNQFH